jgi:hypothetical protein
MHDLSEFGPVLGSSFVLAPVPRFPRSQGAYALHVSQHAFSNRVSRMRGDPHVRFSGEAVLLNTGAHPTRGTEKLIEYKTYLQALPYFDRLEGDRGVTE